MSESVFWVTLWNAHFANVKPARTPSGAIAAGRRFLLANICSKSPAWSTLLLTIRAQLFQALFALRLDIGLPDWAIALSHFYSIPFSCSAFLP